MLDLKIFQRRSVHVEPKALTVGAQALFDALICFNWFFSIVMKSGFFLLLKTADCLLDFLGIVEIGAQLNVLDVAKALLEFNAQNLLDLLYSHLSFSRANLGIDVLNDGV